MSLLGITGNNFIQFLGALTIECKRFVKLGALQGQYVGLPNHQNHMKRFSFPQGETIIGGKKK
jgi:hypothetical protein